MPIDAVSPSPLTPIETRCLVRQHHAGRQRRHAAVNAVEAVRLAQEVSRRLAGAADAAELCDAMRLDAVFVKRLDDLRSDRVVAASGAQRRIARPCIRPPSDPRRLTFFGAAAGGCIVVDIYFFSPFSAAITASVTNRASIGSPL